ncbi:hypothetical protein [Bythopirellula goksoeyrii]|uniref:Uncharacterized protein n=1 Tax=Bythopirellula goksoeyrii TaxID=1400387 RepID=A0A5B9QI69_9BACT|nr:hypothetical protein [Bythopirellula goksoeyrii]QEG37659.1 hypothetical protein Pr1d_50050 [Bythopirellula goksoeyrii]
MNIDCVERVTTDGSPDHVPSAARIAVFDKTFQLPDFEIVN